MLEDLMWDPKRRQSLADWMTIIAAVVAIVALILGFITFQITNRIEREAAATGVLQNYMDMQADRPNIDWEEGDDLDPEYGWMASNALFTAETIYLSRGEDPGWNLTAAGIVEDYDEFILSPRWREEPGNGDAPWFQCGYYSEDFISFVEDQLDKNVCSSWPLFNRN